MIRSLRASLCILCSLAGGASATNTAWQQARIVEVQTITNNRASAGVVNTPIVDEEKLSKITIHLGTRIVLGSYVLGKTQAASPAEWITHAPVRAQLVGDTLFLKAMTGEQYRLRVESNKLGPATDPWTADELEAEKNANTVERERTNSGVGLNEPQNPAKSTPATPPVAAAPSSSSHVAVPAEPSTPDTTGTISISSTPYLADI
jgi:hypothetical protein